MIKASGLLLRARKFLLFRRALSDRFGPATIEVKSNRRQVYIEAEAQCSSSTILDAVANGQAKFVLHVECRGTFFRQAFPFVGSKTRIAVSAAAQGINDYRVEKAHPDYADTVIRIRRDDILVVGRRPRV